MGIIWTIVIGFIAGVIAKFIMPGSSNEPSGFVLTTILGIVGAVVASYLGQALGWYSPGEGAGLIGAGLATASPVCSPSVISSSAAPTLVTAVRIVRPVSASATTRLARDALATTYAYSALSGVADQKEDAWTWLAARCAWPS